MKTKQKIGIGISTRNREDLFIKCAESMPEVDSFIIVNDGLPYKDNSYPSCANEVIQNKKNLGVGKTKNLSLRYLLDQGCTHIFLAEDDIFIKNKSVCEKYIHAAEITGIEHFNFGYHGPNNKTSLGIPNPRRVKEYEQGIKIAFNEHVPGAFSYYRREVLEQTGLIDEIFFNAWEHVDLTQRIISKGFHPPFWWFADLADSHEYIGDLDEDLERSVIRENENKFKMRVKIYSIYYTLKHGHRAWKTKDTSEAEVLDILELIKLQRGYFKRK